MEYYREKDLNELKLIMEKYEFKREEFRIEYLSASATAVPPLIIYYPKKRFQFIARLLPLPHTFEFEIKPNAKTNRLMRIRANKRGDEFEIIKDYFETWIRYVKEDTHTSITPPEQIHQPTGGKIYSTPEEFFKDVIKGGTNSGTYIQD